MASIFQVFIHAKDMLQLELYESMWIMAADLWHRKGCVIMAVEMMVASNTQHFYCSQTMSKASKL